MCHQNVCTVDSIALCVLSLGAMPGRRAAGGGRQVPAASRGGPVQQGKAHKLDLPLHACCNRIVVVVVTGAADRKYRIGASQSPLKHSFGELSMGQLISFFVCSIRSREREGKSGREITNI